MTKRTKQSAGLLMFRIAGSIEVFLVHPGGPFWSKKAEGSLTLPKGEYGEDEEPLAAARCEFTEETGFATSGSFLELGSVRQKSGKIVCAWAFNGDCDPDQLVSNTCEIEWPPRSNQHMVISEVDGGAWFTLTNATASIREEQRPFLARLDDFLRNQ